MKITDGVCSSRWIITLIFDIFRIGKGEGMLNLLHIFSFSKVCRLLLSQFRIVLFMSCYFMSCKLVRQFHVRHFHVHMLHWYIFSAPVPIILVFCDVRFIYQCCVGPYTSNITKTYYTSIEHRSANVFKVFTARCYAERGYATVSRLSVPLSVCLSVRMYVTFMCFSHRLKCFEINFTAN